MIHAKLMNRERVYLTLAIRVPCVRVVSTLSSFHSVFPMAKTADGKWRESWFVYGIVLRSIWISLEGLKLFFFVSNIFVSL